MRALKGATPEISTAHQPKPCSSQCWRKRASCERRQILAPERPEEQPGRPADGDPRHANPGGCASVILTA
ncbi:MAG TPA: hypothetical protein VLQ79_06520, partial [Myxococcaceae bacterium]|nr:hypothetical protein [Myxococcaceae bacterium]